MLASEIEFSTGTYPSFKHDWNPQIMPCGIMPLNILQKIDSKFLSSKILLDWSFFAVFDGHGGDEVAKKGFHETKQESPDWSSFELKFDSQCENPIQRAAEKMLPILLENEAVKKIQTGLDYDPNEIEIALRDTFISVDTELHKLMKNYRRFAGKILQLYLIKRAC